MNESIRLNEDFYLEPKPEEAIENFPEPFQLVEPILRLIENNPWIEYIGIKENDPRRACARQGV